MRNTININMADRFDKVLKAKGIVNIRSFETECKIANNQVSKIIQKGKCRTDTLAKILLHEAFSDVSPRWLLTGQGEMLLKIPLEIEKSSSNTDLQARREIMSLKQDFQHLKDDQIKIWGVLDEHLLSKKINPGGNLLTKGRQVAG
jgi:hypothetical protein